MFYRLSYGAEMKRVHINLVNSTKGALAEHCTKSARSLHFWNTVDFKSSFNLRDLTKYSCKCL